jgi:hypothetical protein
VDRNFGLFNYVSTIVVFHTNRNFGLFYCVCSIVVFLEKQQKYKHSKTNQSYDPHRRQQYYKHNKTNQSYDPHRKTTIVETQ